MTDSYILDRINFKTNKHMHGENGKQVDALEPPSEWPADGLEPVPNCPVCGADTRKLLHEGLTDQVFYCAPGKWNMYRCESCASAYLDPRPNHETISLAYQHYFTHDEVPSFKSLSFLGKFRRRIANGYRNHYFGTQDYPASIIGIIAASLIPNIGAIIDANMRHLRKENTKKRLLDVGCGNGGFLLLARSAGWDVVGVDPDSEAVEAARIQDLDVRLGGVEALDPSIEQFDTITLSHVIEHVHQPVEVLQACHRLLRPGGFLWIETPNIASQGHRLFDASWRGLEPPRHLVLFTLESMRSALSTAGFAEVKTQSYRPTCKRVFSASTAISEGIDPHIEPRRNAPSGLVRKAEQIAKHDPEQREFITVKAWKR